MLRFDKVSKQYGGRNIVREISLRLSGGEIVLLAGSNGVGKSTVLRLAAGLTAPSSGNVEMEDVRLGYLGHGTGVYANLSALENLAFWQRLHNADARVSTLTAALERVGLTRRGRDRAGSFSRGMVQRLNLARLLLQDPDVLLLDEPGTGLDPQSVGLLTAEVLAARARGAGVLWVSHDLGRDLPLADRVLELFWVKGGARLIFDGEPCAWEKQPDATEPTISASGNNTGLPC